jgi:hypothetical protein
MAESKLEPVLTSLEAKVVRVANARTLWNLVDLNNELIKNNVKILSDPVILKNFLIERPHLFQVNQQFAWSKLAPTNIDPQPTPPTRPTTNPESDSTAKLVSNRAFNPVAHLIKTARQTVDSSSKIHLESVDQIFFTIPWLFSHLPKHVRAQWRTQYDLSSELNNEKEFILLGSRVHLWSLIQDSISAGAVARAIVDILLKIQKAVMNTEQLFKKLSEKVRKYLKTVQGLTDFIEFYPTLFRYRDYDISLVMTAGNRANKDVKETQMSDYADQKKYNAVNELLRRTFPEKENTKIVHENNIERPCFKLNWMQKKLPKGLGGSLMFDNAAHLNQFLQRYPSIVLIGSAAHLANIFYDLPCEKSVALEILKLQHQYPRFNDQEIANKLPQWCWKRIRGVNELRKFYELHEDFLISPEQPEPDQEFVRPTHETSKQHQCSSSFASNQDNFDLPPLERLAVKVSNTFSVLDIEDV